MNKLIISLLLLLFSSYLKAQIFDNFEDGDFTNNPSWTGDEIVFKINTGFQLQLDNEGVSDTSYLATANQLIDSVSWEFFIKQSFSPSSNNYTRVYLVSDNENLKGQLNGYFLQFGEAGSNDAIELFRQEDNIITSICRGTEGSVAASFNAKIKVIRKQNGHWVVYSDFGNTGNYSLECQGDDNTITSSSYFGFFCQYTSSNATKFYFDEVEIKHFDVDSQSPKVRSVLVTDNNQLSISYTEVVEVESAENTNHYTVNNGIGNPIDVSMETNQYEVLLDFEDAFTIEEVYQITISGILDLSGNIIADTVISFSRIELDEYAVVINEIMADPTPSIQLPDAEFIEIYNRTTASIDLTGWELQIGTTNKAFPSIIIPSHGYLILCKESNIPFLSEYGDCAGFSSFSLTNGGQMLSLIAPSGVLIHSVSYTDDWYHDPIKDDGGWTLEQINPNDFCSEENNWSASEDNRGGSPGMQNSIFDSTPVLPEIAQLELVDNPLLLLTFSQQMQTADILDKTAYSVSPDIGQPNQVMLYDTSVAVYLSFTQTFEIGIEYILTIDKSMHNCAVQEMTIPVERTFMLNKTAELGDIVINEIMADPEPSLSLPAYEYLELYNNADAPIDLSDWILQFGNTNKTISEIVIPPKSYILLCKEEAVSYFSEFGPAYSISSFSLTNGGTQLALRNREGALIHQVNYSDNWYNDSEKEEGGWSLEAIEPAAYCLEQINWTASIDSRGGSPGTINSVDDLAPETDASMIHRIQVINPINIRVYFTALMDSSSLSVPLFYSIDQGIGTPLQCTIEGPRYNSVGLLLENPLQKGVVYSLETLSGLKECNGADASGLSSPFAIPDQIEKGDIVFNEVLFDAAIDDGEFIELVNISDKILETAGLSISRIKINQYDTSWYTADLSGALLFPKEYIAFAPSASQVLKVYYSEAPERIINLSSFPSLPNENGIILLHLSSSKDSIIDYLEYDEDMHYSLLNDGKGVSLEKMDLYTGSQKDNWHSAASSVNYGTPAYQNSQYRESQEATSVFELVPEIFSPDNDGYDDVLQINYQMPESGITLNLVIYDSRGRQVKHLVKSDLLATEGSYYWNGETDDFQKASIGIYILFFEYFDLEGNVKTEKLSVVLGGRL